MAIIPIPKTRSERGSGTASIPSETERIEFAIANSIAVAFGGRWAASMPVATRPGHTLGRKRA
jgi:hypothetical protein